MMPVTHTAVLLGLFVARGFLGTGSLKCGWWRTKVESGPLWGLLAALQGPHVLGREDPGGGVQGKGTDVGRWPRCVSSSHMYQMGSLDQARHILN